jgi:hypothetical protein
MACILLDNYKPTLKMEAALCFETFVRIDETVRRHISEDYNLPASLTAVYISHGLPLLYVPQTQSVVALSSRSGRLPAP